MNERDLTKFIFVILFLSVIIIILGINLYYQEVEVKEIEIRREIYFTEKAAKFLSWRKIEVTSPLSCNDFNSKILVRYTCGNECPLKYVDCCYIPIHPDYQTNLESCNFKVGETIYFK